MHIPQPHIPHKARTVPATSGARQRPSAALVIVALLAVFSASACGNPDLDAVKHYKLFLENARPALNKMNHTREELFNLTEPDKMLELFEADLLPQVQELTRLANQHPTPDVRRLAEIHITLRNVLENYADSTAKLVERLTTVTREEAKAQRALAAAGADPRADEKAEEAHSKVLFDREQALIFWGHEDQRFGKDMSALVDDLKRYLDELTKR